MLTLVLARAIFVAALLSSNGTLVFRLLIAPKTFASMPRAEAAPIENMLVRLTWISLALAALGLGVWTILQTAAIAGVDSVAPAIAVLPIVLEHTEFGHLVLWQLGLLAATAGFLAAPRSAVIGAAIMSAANLVVHAAHGHSMAMYGWFSFLFAVDALHLLAAGSWVGGLLPLLLVVRSAPAKAAATAARWFSPMGKCCVGVLAGSALIQGLVLVGSFTALGTTPYGYVVLIKTVLFLVLFGFAVLNRYRLAPALRGAEPDIARRRLMDSIIAQTVAGALAVITAAVLSGLAPSMKM